MILSLPSLSRRRRKETLTNSREKVSLVTSTPTRWFMESLHLLLRMHLDHEPLGRDAFHRVRNLRRKKTDAVERIPTGFMESFHFFETHWAHEPARERGLGSAEDSRPYALWWCSVACPQATEATLRRFMESLHRLCPPHANAN